MTEDSDYREQIARVVESHTPHDRVSEWQDINSTVTAVLAVPHPDTAEAARLRDELDEAIERAENANAEAVARQVNLTGLTVEEGAAVLGLESPRELVIAWVDAARKMLGEAENYSETRIDFPAVSMEVKAAGEFERYAFTVQRVGRLTPHEARKQVETERDRLRLAWQSAARGRMRARIERDRQQRQVEMHMGHRNEIQGFLDGVLGTEPEDGAGEGFVADVMLAVRRIQGDLSVARRVLDEVTKKALWLESETQHLRAGLETRTRERDEARGAHPDDRKALADGWAVCRAATVDAIATKLGVTERTDQ